MAPKIEIVPSVLPADFANLGEECRRLGEAGADRIQWDAMDGNFVRGFFNIYYRVAMFSAGATAVSYALAGRFVFAAGAAALTVLAVLLRQQVIPRMDAMRAQIQASGTDAIPGFRRLHVTAILVNLAQLVLIVWGLITLSMQWSAT